LSRRALFPAETAGGLGAPDWRRLRDHLHAQGRVGLEELLLLVQAATAQLRREPNVLKLTDPVTIVGDLHGQYFDLLKMLEIGGEPGPTQYVFLGDYVDRGLYSTEVVLLLYALKLRFPDKVWLLRGNHETRATTQAFSFQEEVLRKYDASAYEAIMDSFDALPLACVINGRFLGLHGGLGPELQDVGALGRLDRFAEPEAGAALDALWADPSDADGPDFYPNDSRGCSHYFTFAGTRRFLERTSLMGIIRAHEAQMEGFRMHHTCGETGFPSVITVFSAPNYCGTYGNKGAILQFADDEMRLRQFHAALQPPPLPPPLALEPAEQRGEELGGDHDEVSRREHAQENVDPAQDGAPVAKPAFEFAPDAPPPARDGGARRRRKLRNAPCKRRASATPGELGLVC